MDKNKNKLKISFKISYRDSFWFDSLVVKESPPSSLENSLRELGGNSSKLRELQVIHCLEPISDRSSPGLPLPADCSLVRGTNLSDNPLAY
jgi:hypothetical protein